MKFESLPLRHSLPLVRPLRRGAGEIAAANADGEPVTREVHKLVRVRPSVKPSSHVR